MVIAADVVWAHYHWLNTANTLTNWLAHQITEDRFTGQYMKTCHIS